MMDVATRTTSHADKAVTGHEILVRARTEEQEWASRTASRVRSFTPERRHAPRHRGDTQSR